AGVLGDDRPVVRIPGRELLARAYRIAVRGEKRRAVGNLVALALAAVVVDDRDLAGPGDRELVALGVGQVAHGGGEAHRAGRLRLDVALHRGPRRRAADVEGPHRQLRAGLADRLRGDHADGFADVHR